MPLPSFQPSSLRNLILNSILLLILISLFVPLAPKMPAPGLDPSWALGLNQAIAQGLAFGKDIIFTLGPYSSIYTKAYHPATDFMMVGGSLYLAISYWLALIFLMKTINWRWFIAFGVIFSAMIYARDSLLFSYPLLVGLISFKTTEKTPAANYKSCLFLAFLFTSFGLLILVKGSLAILCFTSGFLCITLFLATRNYLLASTCLSSILASMMLFWLGSGQSLVHLPAFLWQTFSLASGFSEAMARDGQPSDLLAYLLTSAFILIALARQKQLTAKSRLFLSSIFFVFLFISFKAGFARHFGHAFIPGTSILLMAFFLIFILDKKISLPIMLIACGTWGYINGNYTTISLKNNFKSTYFPAWHGLKSRIIDKNWLRQNFELSLSLLRAYAAFPQLEGTTDIYSFAQSYLLSTENHWSPRPIFQSYSVFSSDLVEKNRRHLMSNNSPDNIIFKLEPIDNRFPSLEDGASWPLLMANYKPRQTLNEFLLLKKKTILTKKNLLSALMSEKHILGEPVTVPLFNQAIFAEFEIKATFWGKLATFFLRSNPLQINLVLKDGTKKHYRLLANMAKTGFLVSPLIENTAEFAKLYDKDEPLDAKMVRSFTITASKNKMNHWSKDYVVHFKILKW